MFKKTKLLKLQVIFNLCCEHHRKYTIGGSRGRGTRGPDPFRKSQMTIGFLKKFGTDPPPPPEAIGPLCDAQVYNSAGIQHVQYSVNCLRCSQSW